MKKIITFLAILLLIFSTKEAVFADNNSKEYTSGDFNYIVLDDGTARIDFDLNSIVDVGNYKDAVTALEQSINFQKAVYEKRDDRTSGIQLAMRMNILSNIYNREQFRSHSVTAGACDRQIYGRGFAGYSDAMEYIDHLLKEREKGK